MAVKQYALCFQLLWAGRSGACINGTGRMAQVEWRRLNGAGRMVQVQMVQVRKNARDLRRYRNANI